ncbi:MAG TPA: hypothetical protein VKC55_04720 [Actinomycetota bacterium]|nr:hypothetical protein [Actinomycetota bacterium]
MSQSSGFDMSKVSTAGRILLIAGVLYLIDLFLPWQRVCIDLGIDLPGGCASASGASGIGVLNLLLVLGLLVWEGLALSTVEINAPKALVSAGLAAAIVVFTILKILIDNESIYLWAWIGLILALVIGYGGWMRWQEHQATGGTTSMGGAAPPPPPGPSA